MAVSKELQLGKAGEHLVVADLILQGYSAFLSDQGLNYDVIADCSGELIRVQVKTTLCPKDYLHRTKTTRGKGLYEFNRSVYRFGLRRAKGGSRAMEIGLVDVFAFVALDTREIAYIKSSDLIRENGKEIILCIEFTALIYLIHPKVEYADY